MGTSSFAVPALRALYEKGEDIAFVVTQPDRIRGRGKAVIPTPVKQYAESVNIKVVQPEEIRDNEDFARSLDEAMVDLIVVASYGKLLPQEILKKPKLGCINIHASLLPKYRGAAPIQWAIADGQAITGVTLMHMSEGLDDGDIGASATIEIESMNAGVLEEKLAEMGATLLLENLDKIREGKLMRIPQDDSQSTYARMLSKEDAHIDLSQDAKTVINRINAMNPVPGSYVIQGDTSVKIKKAHIKEVCDISTGEKNDDYIENTKKDFNISVGSIIAVSDAGIEIKLSDGILVIEEIGMPGKRPMTVKDYLRGNKIDMSIQFN